MEAEAWYARRLDWTAPLRHNIFFSVGSSLVFALLLFALAAWKLKRIDF
jgi:flagellar biogenesis protein FliO